MIFFASGTSGSGKTTLCELAAQGLSLPFIKTDVTGMARAAGFQAVGDLSLADRVQLQEALYDGFEGLCSSVKGPSIFDRSPLDLVMYLMGEVNMHSHKAVDPDTLTWIADYTSRCQRLTSERAAHLFVTMPLPVYETVETRPSFNPAYQEHTNLILMGTLATMTDPLTYTIFRTPDLNTRVDAMMGKISERLDEYEAHRKSCRHVH